MTESARDSKVHFVKKELRLRSGAEFVGTSDIDPDGTYRLIAPIDRNLVGNPTGCTRIGRCEEASKITSKTSLVRCHILLCGDRNLSKAWVDHGGSERNCTHSRRAFKAICII